MEFDQDAILAFVRTNQHLAPLVIFLLAMGETIVVVSVFIPSTFVLFAIGGLMAAAGVPLMPSLIAGGLGASLGFSAMYLISVVLEGRILTFWPFRKHPETMAKATEFFRRWGVLGVAIGHFGGPLRVLVPVVAGIARLKPAPFMLANILGAFGWITTFFAPGYLVVSSDTFREAFGAMKRLF